jgi:hypothetical protein
VIGTVSNTDRCPMPLFSEIDQFSFPDSLRHQTYCDLYNLKQSPVDIAPIFYEQEFLRYFDEMRSHEEC